MVRRYESETEVKCEGEGDQCVHMTSSILIETQVLHEKEREKTKDQANIINPSVSYTECEGKGVEEWVNKLINYGF
jgi:hypothetical protein